MDILSAPAFFAARSARHAVTAISADGAERRLLLRPTGLAAAGTASARPWPRHRRAHVGSHAESPGRSWSGRAWSRWTTGWAGLPGISRRRQGRVHEVGTSQGGEVARRRKSAAAHGMGVMIVRVLQACQQRLITGNLGAGRDARDWRGRLLASFPAAASTFTGLKSRRRESRDRSWHHRRSRQGTMKKLD